ncbi:dihydrodipicolinate synthase family protein [Salipiger sp. 1_MG-2023]|uniref:dihydrodipicolinate synthase family protein n=1 Tax=Salipiger sp. 1_MG-2023 TaxID=3062665 RepID=UPI0026E19C5B|nr:dihydrodipicolinate synthase family protein [Salipiger sp. 1_MG-2023]MDO6586951.1 dihydrodipicolinate synthase family protein [Salipiger sp. 1_MG-2023]
MPFDPTRLHGIHAATVCPLTADFTIDRKALVAHVARVMDCAGIKGLLINGHAGENAQLSRSAKRQVVEILRDAFPDAWLTCGVYSESALEAADHARDVAAAGGDAVLVFPPNGWALGQSLAAVVDHHARIAGASDLPVVLYQAPVTAGRMAYPLDTLLALCALPHVVAIKEGSWEIARYDANRRAVKAAFPDIAVLASGDEHLLTGYLIGTEGSQVSLAAVLPDLTVDLWDAAQAQDWDRARALHDRLAPLVSAIYSPPPGVSPTACLKTCLVLLGHLDNDRTAPPTQPPSDAYREVLRSALDVALDGAQNG